MKNTTLSKEKVRELFYQNEGFKEDSAFKGCDTLTNKEDVFEVFYENGIQFINAFINYANEEDTKQVFINHESPEKIFYHIIIMLYTRATHRFEAEDEEVFSYFSGCHNQETTSYLIRNSKTFNDFNTKGALLELNRKVMSQEQILEGQKELQSMFEGILEQYNNEIEQRRLHFIDCVARATQDMLRTN